MSRRCVVLAVAVVAVLVFSLSGCARARNQATPVPASVPTQSVDPANVPKPSATPEAAVVAYLGIVQQAYYSLDSTAVVPYVTAEQWVREDAYIQLNLTQNQAMQMNLITFEVTKQPSPSAEATSVMLDSAEHWQWRYWDLKSRNPKTGWADTRYSVRYTLERLDSGWLVGGTEVLEQSGEMTPTPVP